MKYLKPYLSYFSYVYALCGGSGLLLQQFFSIKAAMGTLMLAAVAFTAFYFVKQEHRAPTKVEQHYLAQHCTLRALVEIVAFGLLFLLLNAFYHGIDSALAWLKIVLWDMWWLSALLLGVYALTHWGVSLFAFGFLARKHAEKDAS